MKRYTSILPLACCLLLLLAACTPQTLDELAPGTDADARPLAITVTDGGMYSTPDPDRQTRAEERGYQTVFTEGDQIGLYVVRDGAVEKSNLCLTLRGGKWTLPSGTPEVYYTPDRSYYAYYPYKKDNYMTSKVSPADEDFFRKLVLDWSPLPKQNTYAAYTASDLMTATGEYTPDADGNYTLHFSMEHRMALVVFQFPATRYHYTEKIDNRDISKSYYRYTLSDPICLHENPSTGRYLRNPWSRVTIMLDYYYNGQNKQSTVTKEELNLQPGRYTIHQVDGGAVTELQRPLAEGDYYMTDGGILPAEDVINAISADDKKNCLGVVFWVGEKEQDSQTAHWTKTGNQKGDHLLMRDHPGCVHGLVVALHDASPDRKSWSSLPDRLSEWANSYAAFTDEEKKDLDDINKSNVYFGYSRTRLLELYKAGTSARTDAYDAIHDYAGRYPAPSSCSGWYFPGINELLCIWRKTPEATNGELRIDQLNEMLYKAGGDKLKEDIYWASCDVEDKAYRADLVSGGIAGYDPKQNCYYVRAVLAF